MSGKWHSGDTVKGYLFNDIGSMIDGIETFDSRLVDENTLEYKIIIKKEDCKKGSFYVRHQKEDINE